MEHLIARTILRHLPGGEEKHKMVESSLENKQNAVDHYQKAQDSLCTVLLEAKNIVDPSVLTDLLSFANTLDQVRMIGYP